MEADALSRIPLDREVNQDTVKSIMANAITKSNILVEAYAGSTLTINNPPDNTIDYK